MPKGGKDQQKRNFSGALYSQIKWAFKVMQQQGVTYCPTQLGIKRRKP